MEDKKLYAKNDLLMTLAFFLYKSLIILYG